MNIQDILTEFDKPVTIKELKIVDLVFIGPHYCTEIYHWPNLQKITVLLYSHKMYENMIKSEFADEFIVKTIFHLPVQPSDIIEAETVKCPF